RSFAAVRAHVEAVRAVAHLQDRAHLAHEAKASVVFGFVQVPDRDHVASWEYERVPRGYRIAVVDGERRRVLDDDFALRVAEDAALSFARHAAIMTRQSVPVRRIRIRRFPDPSTPAGRRC